jgi:hypothetical protein
MKSIVSKCFKPVASDLAAYLTHLVIMGAIVFAYLSLAAPAFAQHSGHVAAAQAPVVAHVGQASAAQRDLWIGHIFWVRNVVIATVDGNEKAAAAAEKQVVVNAKAIAASIEPFYGKAASETLFGLLAAHYGAVKEHLQATAAGSRARQDEAVKKLTGNATEIARFLSAANPYLPFETLNGLLLAHGGHHIQQNEQIGNRQYAREAQTWHEMKRHIYTIADALAGALARQFPAELG